LREETRRKKKKKKDGRANKKISFSLVIRENIFLFSFLEAKENKNKKKLLLFIFFCLLKAISNPLL
jgi:hypothetical protein